MQGEEYNVQSSSGVALTEAEQVFITGRALFQQAFRSFRARLCVVT